ncbi:Nor-1 [Hypomontagnella monticulosa]|nr:Nor-1 [Hypomontagnella monticulosa]
MSSQATNTNILITGVNRGLGRALAEAYLARPNHIVIGSVRDESSTSAASLKAVKPATGSRLILVKISNDSKTDPAKAVETIKAAGVEWLDIVIANSGIAGRFARLESVSMDDFEEFFEVNTYSVMRLYLAVYPLLKAAADRKGSTAPKFIGISTVASRIMQLEENVPFMLGSYGASKVAVNYLVRRAHAENDWLTAFLLEPGVIQTDMGNSSCRHFGWPEAPIKVQDSVDGLLKQIDGSSRESTGGKFIDYLGAEQQF